MRDALVADLSAITAHEIGPPLIAACCNGATKEVVELHPRWRCSMRSSRRCMPVADRARDEWMSRAVIAALSERQDASRP